MDYSSEMDYSSIKLPWSGWKIVQKIGEGSFGKVYEIERDMYIRECSALKILSLPGNKEELTEYYTDGYDEKSITELYKSYLEKIRDEYRLMNEVKDCPNIVRCEDYCEVEHADEIGWDIFIRMELLTPFITYLDARDKEGNALTEQEIIKLGKDICRAIAACEKENIIHRDIKPGNILVSRHGDFKLGDFGVARTMEHITHATKAGTDLYMAPEVFHHEPYGKEVDTYSLGLVLYKLLNRRRLPFEPTDHVPTLEEKENARLKRIKGDKLPEPADGSAALKETVLKACAFNKEDRYQSAGEMLDDLKRADSGILFSDPKTEESTIDGRTDLKTEESTIGGRTDLKTEEPTTDDSSTNPETKEPTIGDSRKENNPVNDGNKEFSTKGGWIDDDESIGGGFKGKQSKEDDFPTEGSMGKKPEKKRKSGKGKPGKNKEDTPVKKYNLYTSPEVLINGGKQELIIDEGKISVKIPKGCKDGKLLKVPFNDSKVGVVIKAEYTDGKEITPRPSWVRITPKDHSSSLVIVIGIIAVLIGLVLGSIFGAGAAFIITALLVNHIESSKTPIAYRRVGPELIRIEFRNDKKRSINAVAVNGKWVSCVKNATYVYVSAKAGADILWKAYDESGKQISKGDCALK